MKQFAVIGLGRFGESIAKTLFSLEHDVLVIDDNQENIDNIVDYVTHAVKADATDETVLKRLGLRNMDVIVVAIGNIQQSIMICMLLKELGVPMVVAKVQSEMHAKVLTRMGVDKVIFPERDMGIRLAHNLVSSSVLDYIELSDDYSMVEIKADPKWHNKSLRSLNMRVAYGINVIAIRRGEEINVAPNADEVIEKDDTLMVVGSNQSIHLLENKPERSW